MRVLIITLKEHLNAALSNLNSELDICALITDEPEPSAEIMAKHALTDVPIFPFYQLKECVESFYFDKIIIIASYFPNFNIAGMLLQYKIPAEKIVAFDDFKHASEYNTLSKMFNHYAQNAENYRMIVTGASGPYHSVNINLLELPTAKFATPSQDLYYDYQVMSKLCHMGGGDCATLNML